LCLALSLLATTPARAAARGDGACAAGESALREDDLRAAEEAFGECLRGSLDSAQRWRSLVMLAALRRLAGDPVSALSYYRRFLAASNKGELRDIEPWPQTRRHAAEDAAALEAELRASHATLSLTSRPPGALLLVDGKPTGQAGAERTPLQAFVAPGIHDIELRLEGHRPWKAAVNLGPGQVLLDEVELRPAAGAHRDPLDAAPLSKDEDTALSTAGYVAAGAGGALLIAGGVLSAFAASELSTVRDLADKPSITPAQADEFRQRSERVESFELGSWLLYGAGAAALGTGLLLLLQDGGAESGGPEPAAGLGPVGGGAGLWLRGRF